MQVKLLSYTPEPVKAIVLAAANCWQSIGHEGTPEQIRLLNHIVQAGHWTPLEFAVFNFEISGVSRALTHQLVRKRVGVAFAQESQRYVVQDGFDYVTPPNINYCNEKFLYIDRTARQIYIHAMRIAQASYEQLTALGIPAEDARYILPNACTSTIHMSINYHALLDLAKERLCSRAQWEIRELVGKLKDVVWDASALLAEYMQPKCYWLKRCPEGRECELYAGD